MCVCVCDISGVCAFACHLVHVCVLVCACMPVRACGCLYCLCVSGVIVARAAGAPTGWGVGRKAGTAEELSLLSLATH